MPVLTNVLKVTSAQYNTLANGGTVGSHTGLEAGAIYLIQDSGLYVSYSTAQELSDLQKEMARTNIGAGTSNLTLGTTSTTAARGNHTHSIYVPYTNATTNVNLGAHTFTAQSITVTNTNSDTSTLSVTASGVVQFDTTTATGSIALKFYNNYVESIESDGSTTNTYRHWYINELSASGMSTRIDVWGLDDGVYRRYVPVLAINLYLYYDPSNIDNSHRISFNADDILYINNTKNAQGAVTKTEWSIYSISKGCITYKGETTPSSGSCTSLQKYRHVLRITRVYAGNYPGGTVLVTVDNNSSTAITTISDTITAIQTYAGGTGSDYYIQATGFYASSSSSSYHIYGVYISSSQIYGIYADAYGKNQIAMGGVDSGTFTITDNVITL